MFEERGSDVYYLKDHPKDNHDGVGFTIGVSDNNYTFTF
jgi:hypothetical protein